MFYCFNVTSINPVMSFRSFDVSHMRKWGVDDNFSTQFLLILSVLFFPWKRFFLPFRTIFQCANVASIGPAISFQYFDGSQGRTWRRCHNFCTQFLLNFSVLLFPWKCLIIPSRNMFQYVNVASIGFAISFRSFDVSYWGRAISSHAIFAQFWCSFFPLNVLAYTLQLYVLVKKCGQYWSGNFISKFWCFTHWGRAISSNPILAQF